MRQKPVQNGECLVHSKFYIAEVEGCEGESGAVHKAVVDYKNGQTELEVMTWIYIRLRKP